MPTATFTALLNDIYTITNRPDLVAETTLAVKVATLKAHQTDYYPKDLRDEAVDFGTSHFTHILEYKVIFPRWRNLSTFRHFDGTTGGIPSVPFKVLTPDNVVDQYNVQKENVMYLAGQVYQIKSAASFRYALIAYYQFPLLDTEIYDSWIALEQPYLIVFDAAISVMLAIGLREEAAGIRVMRDEQIQLLRISNTLAEGY